MLHALPRPRRSILVVVVLIALGIALVAMLPVPSASTDGTRGRTPSEGRSLDKKSTVDAAAPSTMPDATDAFAPAEGGTALRSAGAIVEADASSAPAGSAVDIGLRVIRNATMTLRIKQGAIEERTSSISSAVDGAGGYVVSSSLSRARGDGASSASITVRVPGGEFHRVLERLRKLGTVQTLDVSTQDATEEYVDVNSRLRHDRAVERRILALLAQTKTVSEALAVQARLDAVQEQIEISQGRLNYLNKVTKMATISVTLDESGGAASKSSDGDTIEWGFGDALKTAAERFAHRVNGAVIALGGVAPLLLFAIACFFAGRAALRHRAARADARSQQ